MAGPSGLKLGGLVEGMCPKVLMKEFFRCVLCDEGASSITNVSLI